MRSATRTAVIPRLARRRNAPSTATAASSRASATGNPSAAPAAIGGPRRADALAMARSRKPSAGWDAVAGWYDGWMGSGGSAHHRQLAVPLALRLLEPARGSRILDVGCGQGVLAERILAAGAQYVGIDASPRLIEAAAKRHHRARFAVDDARTLAGVPREPTFDGVIFLLSIQDMEDLAAVVRAACERLKPGGRLAMVLTHPCFRIPRQSGWGWDEGRKLRYRRIDRYLTSLDVPSRATSAGTGMTVSHHRPLSAYAQALAAHGCAIDRLDELPGLPQPPHAREPDNPDIPLLLGLRAWKPMGAGKASEGR